MHPSRLLQNTMLGLLQKWLITTSYSRSFSRFSNRKSFLAGPQGQIKISCSSLC
jgi:hypothetical protein